MLKKILLVILILVLPLAMLAQTISEPCDGSDPFDNNCPLDTGVIYMVLLAAALAALQLVKARKLAAGNACRQFPGKVYSTGTAENA
jgi:hypothetical protein